MFAFLTVCDGIIVGVIVFCLIDLLFDDKPIVRFWKVLSGIILGVTYFLLCAKLNYIEISRGISITAAFLIFFGPIALLAILLMVNSIFKK